MKKLTAVLLSVSLLLTGCGTVKQNSGELTESYPWNNDFVTESENGYYISVGDIDSLGHYRYLYNSYFDKNYGEMMMLCSRPECDHDGSSSCPATYKRMMCSNTVLYDNAIWFVGLERSDDDASVVLFRAAADGSAIDRVKTLMTRKTESPSAFYALEAGSKVEIKDGRAYLRYGMETGEGGFGGFIGSELAVVDLNNNNSLEKLMVRDDFFGDSVSDFFVCGNGIVAKKHFRSGSSKNIGDAYVLYSGDDYAETVLDLDYSKNEILGNDYDKFYCMRGPESGKGEQGKFIFGYNPETGEISDEINITDYTPGTVLSYQGRLYVSHWGRTEVTVYENGKELLTFDCEPEGQTDCDPFVFVGGISGGKYYLVSSGGMLNFPINFYSCSLEDIFSGEYKFEKLFNVEKQFAAFLALYTGEGEEY